MIDETINCPTGGREAIQYVMNILQKSGVGAPKQVFLHSHRVTKENVREFLESLNKEQTVPKKIIRVGYAQVGRKARGVLPILWKKAGSPCVN